jgi:hypothetical protein
MGCGVASQKLATKTNAAASTSITSTAVDEAQSAAWAAEGTRLIQAKQTQISASQPQPLNAALFACESTPVDITQAGTYTLDYGPLQSSFDYPTNPSGVAFEFPSDIQFTIIPNGPASIQTISGSRMFVETFSVTNFSAPYAALTGWIY